MKASSTQSSVNGQPPVNRQSSDNTQASVNAQAPGIKNKLALAVTWLCYLGLITLMVLTSVPPFIPEQSSPWLIGAIKVIPLVIVLPGMLRDKLRSYVWLSFIILFYFAQSVVEAFLSSAATLDVLITALTVTLFIAAMLYIKWERARGRVLFEQVEYLDS